MPRMPILFVSAVRKTSMGEHDVDNEGNEIHPVFAGDEGEHMCGSCGCNLMED